MICFIRTTNNNIVVRAPAKVKITCPVNNRTLMRVSEHVFLVDVAVDNLMLNEEHIDYKWVKIDDFEREIWWEGSREPLKRIIDKVRQEYNLS